MNLLTEISFGCAGLARWNGEANSTFSFHQTRLDINLYSHFFLQFKNKLKSLSRSYTCMESQQQQPNYIFLPTIFISQTFPTVKKSVKI